MNREILKVGFYGTGKVALSIGKHLRNRGFELGYCGRNLEKARRYLQDIHALSFVSPNDLIDWCDCICFAVTDSAISEVSGDLVAEDKYAFHMSGALTADEIKGRFAEKFSLHPLRAFAKVESDLSDTAFALEIYKNRYSPEIDRFANAFGKIIRLKSEQKVLYHASAVIASNLIVPVIASANDLLKQIGIEDETLLWSLIDSAVTNMKNLGVRNALTGPIARGDEVTVRRHLSDLCATNPEMMRLYILLSEYALQLSEAPQEKKDAVLKLLREGGNT